MRVIGTAGHVDHGKSALVQALTGINPDRLKEEREREMTIDLGFAWLTLPEGVVGAGEEVGIVDVPGHRDFIENMLAGVGGIDAVLFVVAADEGVMPQTREHLAILDLLQVPAGLVVLTKIDTIGGDESSRTEWLDLVEMDLRMILQNTILQEAPVLRVSARSGKGIPELVSALGEILADRPPRQDLNRPRLPIDRVFSMSGFGTVVTGTLTDGSLNVGDEVEILPVMLRSRIRGLQSHKHKESQAVPGSRTAVNISGISIDQIQRGFVLAHPGDYRPTRRLDASFRLLADASSPVHHNLEVKFFSGTAEVVSRLRLLGMDELLPGEEGWIQLELSQPVVVARGDRYILRRPSPGETLGGGEVVDPHPKRRHKRFTQITLNNLEALSRGTPQDIILQNLQVIDAAGFKDLIQSSTLPRDSAEAALRELILQGLVIDLASKDQSIDTIRENTSEALESPLNIQDAFLVSKTFLDQLTNQAIKAVETYHMNNPLRIGMPREELKSRLKIGGASASRLFNLLLEYWNRSRILVESGPYLAKPEFRIVFNPKQQADVDNLTAKFTASPYSPPSLKECQAQVGEDVVDALIELDKLQQVAPDVVFLKQDYERMVEELVSMMKTGDTLTVAQVRDRYDTSRKYALALMEHLDAIGVTVRKGDERRLKK